MEIEHNDYCAERDPGFETVVAAVLECVLMSWLRLFGADDDHLLIPGKEMMIRIQKLSLRSGISGTFLAIKGIEIQDNRMLFDGRTVCFDKGLLLPQSLIDDGGMVS